MSPKVMPGWAEMPLFHPSKSVLMFTIFTPPIL